MRGSERAATRIYAKYARITNASRRMSPKIQECAQREVGNMFEQDIIDRSACEWYSASVIVRKANIIISASVFGIEIR